MPSRQKTLYFMACACSTAIAAGLLGFAMSQSWAVTRLECDRGDDTFNGTAVITWELFTGFYQRQSCPLIGTYSEINVFSELSGAPVALYGLVVLCLVVCLICSALSILIALYNSVSNPYETYMGPMGVYVCNSISACLSVVVLIFYAVTITATNITLQVVWNYAQGVPVSTRGDGEEVKLGYFLVIPYMVLSLAGIGVVYMYDHAAYTQRREQQRPTEDAPREVMMY